MTGLLKACCLALVLVWPVAATAQSSATQSSRAQNPDTERADIVTFARHALMANHYDDALEAEIFRLQGATDWLSYASGVRSDLGEALVHANRVHDLITAALPSLRARLAAFPKDTPSIPPAFYWFSEWRAGRGASLDALALELDYLAREAAALEAEDWQTVQDLRRDRAQDLVAFQDFYDNLMHKVTAQMPEDHPERLLAEVFAPWEDYYQLVADREATSDEVEARALTLEIIEIARTAVSEMEALADRLEAALPAYGEVLNPVAATLTGDDTAGAVLTREILDSYGQSVAQVRGIAATHREMVRLEAEFWRDGYSQPLMDRFEQLSTRVSQNSKRFYAEWTVRAELLHAAIPGDQE